MKGEKERDERRRMGMRMRTREEILKERERAIGMTPQF